MTIARTDPVLAEKTTVTARAVSLGVSRAALYYRPKQPAKDTLFKQAIEAVLADNPSYGHKRIAIELGLNKKRVRRVMKLFGIKPYRRRIRPEKPDDQHKAPSPYQNLVQRLCPIRPHVVWATDFTYFWFLDRWIYLATVIDIYTRTMIGWHLSRSHDRFLVMAALTQALARTQTVPEYHHSDQGSEYESADYLAILHDYGVTISMSRKSSPWENGFQESFYSQFKVDLGYIDRFATIGELTEAIHRQIHYYNNRRIHTSLKMPPAQFAKQHAHLLKTAAH